MRLPRPQATTVGPASPSRRALLTGAATTVGPASPSRRALLTGAGAGVAALALPGGLGVLAAPALAGTRSAATDVAAAITQLITHERTSRGLPALSVDLRLGAVAQGWSARMRDAGGLSHNRDRFAEYGWPVDDIAEVVALVRGRDLGSAPRGLVDAWMGSPAHRRILLGDWTHLGVGWASAADGTVYATGNVIHSALTAVGREALALSEEAFEAGGARRMVIVRDDVAADALAAAALVEGDVPLLLTRPGYPLPPAVLAEVARVVGRGGTVHLVGGGIPGVVDAQLRDVGTTPRRIVGASRFETSALVAEEVVALRGEPWRVVLVSGSAWADAASAGAFAAAHATPVLLTTSGDLHPAAARFLARVPDADRVVVGGAAVVSDRVAGQAGAWRITGPDRAATGARVMLDAWATSARPGGHLVVTPGWAADGWGTALAHTTYSVRHGAPLLFADAGIPSSVREALSAVGFGPSAPASLRFARDVPASARDAFVAATR